MTHNEADGARPVEMDERLTRVEAAIAALTAGQQSTLDEMRVRWQQEDAIMRHLELRSEVAIEASRQERDNLQTLAARLHDFRSSPGYESSWGDEHPLVSVRIATYNRTEELIDVAIDSVLHQSYDNIEIVVVNDGPNPTTRAAVIALGNPRIRYFELPQRGSYPSNAHLRWMVAGAPAMNEAARLASGAWIAPLDDDDEFAGDHIEKLLELARAEQAELAYGALIQRDINQGVDRLIYSDPPEVGAFSFQSTMYLAGLRFFEYDVQSWRVDEPADWNLARRMVAAGVRMASTKDVHAFMNARRFDQRDDS